MGDLRHAGQDAGGAMQPLRHVGTSGRRCGGHAGLLRQRRGALPQYAAGPAPSYPILAIGDFPGHLRITYAGVGEIQAWIEGRWFRLVGLNSATYRQAVVTVPERFTGLDIHLGYHELHVYELAVLYRVSGTQVLLDYARRWMALAPTMNGILDGIVAQPLTDPPIVATSGTSAGHHLLRRGPVDSPAITWVVPLFAQPTDPLNDGRG